MRLSFTKMHGLGNDFVVFDAETTGLPDSARLRALADRHTGIGFDQALALYPPRRPDTDVYYRIFNADGAEVEQCGNGARCIAAHVAARAATADPSRELRMDSPGGLVRARVMADGVVAVAMSVPDFAPAAVPFLADAEADTYRLDGPTGTGAALEVSAVSMGNPHVVLRVADVLLAPVASVGPALEYHPRFPQRANVGFMQIVSASHIRLRVHERGVGETRACGTGACAAVAVGRRLGLLEERVDVDLPGGRLSVEWKGASEPIWLIGPTATVFEGHTTP